MRTTVTNPNVNQSLLPVINRSRNAARAMGGLGILALLVGIVFMSLGGRSMAGWTAFYQSYLFAYVFWVSLTLGCFGITLLHHTVRGTWGVTILRIIEAGNKTLPIMAMLFVPILFPMLVLVFRPDGFTDLTFYPYYHWADHHHVESDKVLQHKAVYLNPTFWVIRTFIYFAVWIALSSFLNRSSLKQDRTHDQNLAQQRTDWSAPGIVIFMVTVTFAFTDWVMSLDPHWFSTIYGVWFAVTQGLSALALGTYIVTKYSDRRPFSEFVTPQVTRDLGNMLLGFTMLWGYISLSQFLIIWSGNLPEENGYYLDRFKGPLVYIGAGLIIFQFFAPFLALISGRTKRTPGLLRKVAAGILIVRVVDIFWNVTPFYRDGMGMQHIGAYLLDIAAFLALGGIWMAVFLGELKRHPIVPLHDTRLQEAAAEAHHHA